MSAIPSMVVLQETLTLLPLALDDTPLNNLLLLELLKHPDRYEIVSFPTPGSAPPSYVRQMAREWALT